MRKNDMIKVYIIRWSAPITFQSGEVSNMLSRLGEKEEVEAYAYEMAKRHGVKVEVIV